MRGHTRKECHQGLIDVEGVIANADYGIYLRLVRQADRSQVHPAAKVLAAGNPVEWASAWDSPD
jgi:hypothetical protein